MQPASFECWRLGGCDFVSEEAWFECRGKQRIARCVRYRDAQQEMVGRPLSLQHDCLYSSGDPLVDQQVEDYSILVLLANNSDAQEYPCDSESGCRSHISGLGGGGR